MKQRHELLSRSNIYIRRHSCDASLSVEQLQEMVGTMNSTQFMNCLQRYAAKPLGSGNTGMLDIKNLKLYLNKKDRLHIFWTVSCADKYWPELHSLLPHTNNADVTHSMRVNAVISNPHITEFFFFTLS